MTIHQSQVQNKANHIPVIAGVEITIDEQGRFNLNALHRASGTGDHKKPSEWLRTKQASELICELQKKLSGDSRLAQETTNIETPVFSNQTANSQSGHENQSPKSGLAQEVVSVIKGGVSPGTFAHELLAISYAGWISPAFQLQVNQVFLDYRTGKLSPVVDPMAALNDPATMRGILLTYTEKVLVLESKVEEMRPDVEALERIAKADGSLNLTEAAKALQQPPRKFSQHLCSQHWIYKRPGAKHWLGYQDKVQQGLVEHKVTTVTLADGSDRLCEQVRITPKGIAKLAQQFSAGGAA